ncbi:GAF domain-containing protein [Lacisediminihabitans profunda]|uniref:GAF domain-containing protein n=1 Tax=Lacisediminihabitans profunda TaxID=2594790 RepID=A0A5C8UUH8_9MICO|nr:GAF domain-containing protein [Lacisediminihabitans profunda]TXN32284.1 GAF domain-containing protein [Lacisediminihabitans profunda]
MPVHISDFFVRPVILGWLLSVWQKWLALARPIDEPHVRTIGVDPDRILLMGDALAVGYGVSSWDRSLGGHLAREVSAHTDRATDVEIVGNASLNAVGCLRALRGRDLGLLDAIITTIGVNEALQLVPVFLWRRRLARLFAFVDQETPVSLLLFVVAVPPTGLLSRLPDFVLGPTSRHARRLNEVTRRACDGHDRITFIPFDPPLPESVDRELAETDVYATSETYREWASLIAPLVVEGFVPAASSIRFVQRNETLRQEALDALGILDTPNEGRFDAIVKRAQEAFGTDAAAITLIDHDRQWFKSVIGMPPVEVPRALSFCSTTIARTDQFTIEDTAADPVFKTHPFVVGGPKVRFYAGVAIETSDGQRLGALCIVDTRPRKFSRADAALLRDLARQVQEEMMNGPAKTKKHAPHA